MITKLNEKEKPEWERVYGEARQLLSVERSSKIATEHIKGLRNQRVNSIKAIPIETKESNFIVRDDNGEFYFDATLMSTRTNNDGISFDIGLLNKWADYINANGILGDVDHDLFNSMVREGHSEQEILDFMKNKPGISKAVKAYIKNGALKIRAWIDKRYKNVLEKAKGLSLESIVSKTDSDNPNHVLDGDLFGFTFNVNSNPASEDAKIDE